MKDVKIGEEFWTWAQPHNRKAMVSVRKVKIKDIFTIMVTAEVNGSGWYIDVARDDLYPTQEEAMQALQKELDRVQK